MDSLLLIGPEGQESRRVKSHLLKQGFHATSGEFDDLEHLAEKEGRFLLGLVDATRAIHLRDSIEQVRKNPPCKELPLVILLREEQLKELRAVGGLEDFLVLPAAPELTYYDPKGTKKRCQACRLTPR